MSTTDRLLRIESSCLFYTGNLKITLPPEGLKILKGITLLYGRNGSGKTVFAKILEKGRNFRTNRIISCNGKELRIKRVEFNDIHSLPGVSIGYYQQRYESGMNDEIPSVGEVLGDKIKNRNFRELCMEFNLTEIENKKLNHLSSGELRKLLIINSLVDLPDLLILDNPYIGLDKESKDVLDRTLLSLKKKGQSLMLLIPDKEEAPDFIDYELEIVEGKIGESKSYEISDNYKPFKFTRKEMDFSENVCELKNCIINYGDIRIIENFNWTIKRGERWSLSGRNGSGKSTLLSLLNADNPKSYCNEIYLFGRKRGTGESIWEIKKKIGYVSPEMQLHFHSSDTVLKIIANGLNDTVGNYVKPTKAQESKALEWMTHFNIIHLEDRGFQSLSSGERQIVLIARSFIKEPELLILDEPMHALDKWNREIVIRTIEDYLSFHKKSAFIMVTHNPRFLPPSVNNAKKL